MLRINQIRALAVGERSCRLRLRHARSSRISLGRFGASDLFVCVGSGSSLLPLPFFGLTVGVAASAAATSAAEVIGRAQMASSSFSLPILQRHEPGERVPPRVQQLRRQLQPTLGDRRGRGLLAFFLAQGSRHKKSKVKHQLYNSRNNKVKAKSEVLAELREL